MASTRSAAEDDSDRHDDAMYDSDDAEYEGPYNADGEMHGRGTYRYNSSGDVYVGDFYHDLMHGQGRYTWGAGKQNQKKSSRNTTTTSATTDASGSGGGGSSGAAAAYDNDDGGEELAYYDGQYFNDCYHGKGVLHLPPIETYDGEWRHDKRHGMGTVISHADGSSYTGQWMENERNGEGVLRDGRGNVEYDGHFVAGVRHGHGIGYGVDETTGGKLTYGGEWNRNMRTGRGELTLADPNDGSIRLHYDGEFLDNVFHGQGVLTWGDPKKKKEAARDGKDGGGVRTFIGAFRAGQRHGAGIERDGNGCIKGTWEDGQPTAGTVYKPYKDLEEGVLKALEESQQRMLQGAMAKNDVASVGSLLSRDPRVFNDSDFEGWQVISLLGRGAFGAAYKALLRDGRYVCVKVIELGAINANDGMAKLHTEIDLMKRLNHPNIVQYYGSNTDKTKKTLNIFMECVEGGSLTNYAKAFAAKSSGLTSPNTAPLAADGAAAAGGKKPAAAPTPPRDIPPAVLRDWCYQIVCGAKYLHDSNIVHRDIKCDNILVSMDGVLKLADFGCSKSLDDVCSQTYGCMTMAGTPYWMAPEVITCASGGGGNGQQGYGPKSDVWSIGCTIIEAITGKPAWPECTSMWAAIYKIANSTGLPAFFQENPDADPQLRAFLARMFERAFADRADTKELLDHPYLASYAK